jgi:putative holliday junction resolvase
MIERVLAVDYGRKRIGLASCDPLGITVQPLDTLHGEPAKALPAIAALCIDREVARIVVGLPLNMNGSEGDMAREVRAFGAKLAEATKLPIEFSDERLTSWSAEQELAVFKKKLRRKKGLVDAMAAVQILRDWLATRR